MASNWTFLSWYLSNEVTGHTMCVCVRERDRDEMVVLRRTDSLSSLSSLHVPLCLSPYRYIHIYVD